MDLHVKVALVREHLAVKVADRIQMPNVPKAESRAKVVRHKRVVLLVKAVAALRVGNHVVTVQPVPKARQIVKSKTVVHALHVRVRIADQALLAIVHQADLRCAAKAENAHRTANHNRLASARKCLGSLNVCFRN